MKRKGSAVWKGGLKDGKGTVSSDSGVLSNTQYSFSTRFEDGKGTNPEELIAAAHAGCFSMALSAQLGNAGMTAESIATTATVNLEKTDAGFTIETIRFLNRPAVPGWWLSSRVLKRRVMPKSQLKAFKWVMPLLKLEERSEPSFGLSLLVLARRP